MPRLERKHAVNFICTECDSMFQNDPRRCCYCGGEIISMKLRKKMDAHNRAVVAMVNRAMGLPTKAKYEVPAK